MSDNDYAPIAKRNTEISRMERFLITAFFFMIAGAAVYASQTETIDQCKMLYDNDLLALGIAPK